MNTFIVIPVFNEGAVLNTVISHLSIYSYKIIIVDDGSDKVVNPVLGYRNVYFLRHKVNLGQGAALQTGIEFALSKGAEHIVTFDADGQHMASDVEKLLQELKNNTVDIVMGSRFLAEASHNMPRARKIMIKVARYINFFFTGLLLTDAHNGLRAFNKKAASAICITENRMAHATEILSIIKKKKLRYREVPVCIEYSSYSLKKGQTLWSSFRVFLDLLLYKIFR